MRLVNSLLFIFLSTFYINFINANSYNSLGQTGLINLPSAEVHQEQSIYLTLSRSPYIKLGTLTATPFPWLEASYFYYRPDDLYWGSAKGLYLDKGFNIKFSFKPDSIIFPRFALGLDDFAGTGQFTREYLVATYNFNNFKFTSGIGWGKYVGTNSIKNPLSILNDKFNDRLSTSNNYNLGGSPSYDLWFRGPSAIFAGAEIKVPKISNLSFKIETDTFDYFKFGCCGEGLSKESLILRKKDSDINFGLSYNLNKFGNIDLSYIKGNSWNLVFSIGFSSKNNLRKKNKLDA